jgi:hypothetical protein
VGVLLFRAMQSWLRRLALSLPGQRRCTHGWAPFVELCPHQIDAQLVLLLSRFDAWGCWCVAAAVLQEYAGIDAERLERMEARLKADVLAEAGATAVWVSNQ